MTGISHEQALQLMQPEYRARLDAAERAALAAHLAACAGCRAAAEELAALDETLAQALRSRWAGARPAPDARARVRARLEGPAVHRRFIGFAGAVASLAVLALVAWLLSQMVPGPARPAVTATPPAATSAPVAGTPTPIDTPDRAPGGTPALGKVAYVQDGDIWVKALPGGAPQRLTEGGGHLRPRWSPSGAWLTFEQGARLWLVRADGTGAHAVADIATTGAYAWSPVDDRLAFVYSPGQICVRAGAALAGESATGERCVTLSVASGLANPPQGPETDRDLRWSPDGSELVFVREWAAAERSDGGRDYVGIWTLAAQGDSLPVERYGVAAPADGIQLAGWSPGGRALLYWTIPLFSSSIAADGVPLWAVTLDGQAPAPSPYVTLPYDDYVAGSAAPEQLALVVGSGRETWSNKQLVWAYGDTAQPVTLTQGTEAAAWPAFVPDGTRLAYVAMPAVSGLDGDALRAALMARRIWIAEPGTQAAPRRLVDDAAYRDERPQWSADGAWILFARFDAAGKASLWLVSSAGGEAQRVVDVLGGTVDQQPVPDPLGFYGHVDWGSVYSWWRGAQAP